MKNYWIVGGNEIHGFVVSCLARPNEKPANCARTWITTKASRFLVVKTWASKEKAQAVCVRLNRYA